MTDKKAGNLTKNAFFSRETVDRGFNVMEPVVLAELQIDYRGKAILITTFW